MVLAQAAPIPVSPIVVPLTSGASVERTVHGSLRLLVSGDPGGFVVEVVSSKRLRGCYHNLVHEAPHGPDPSDVMPWHVKSRYFENTRVIPVCGRALEVKISLQSPALSPDGERFTAGSLVVTVLPARRASRAGD